MDSPKSNTLQAVEYQQCIESFRKGLELLLQIETTLALAALTVFGLALNGSKAGLLWLITLLLILMFRGIGTAFNWFYILIERATQIEEEIGEKEKSLITQYHNFLFGKRLSNSSPSNPQDR